MKELLKQLLGPDDDGRAFIEALLLRASGALHRRRVASARSPLPAFGWLERWARPWVIAALVGVALAASLPALRLAGARSVAVEPAAPAEAILVEPQPDIVLAISPVR